jgi:Ca2+-binding RTX toxin-like protein
LVGGAGNDTLAGGSGDNVLTGNGGFDDFIFQQALAGSSTITDFSTTNDLISLVGFGSSFDPLGHVHDTSGGALLSLGSAGSVMLDHVQAADLSAANFKVT